MMSSVLLLNATYEPLGVVNLQRAVRLLFSGKVEVLHQSERRMRSEKLSFPLPSVLRMLYYIAHRRRGVPLTKRNVALRDDFKCGYCGVKCGADLTVDHIVPKSRGGSSSWDNLVSACTRCNSRKNDRTPDEARMPLLIEPRRPRYIPFVTIKRHTHAPEDWLK
jgi:5-methylcytosine-specific restriction endonuclease McrA